MMKFFILAICLALSAAITQAQPIRINEVMSSNGGVITDSDGDTSDWIELYNAGTASVNLKGFGLSDKIAEPLKWVFPDFQFNPGNYLIVFASGKDRNVAPVNWNTIISQGDVWKYLVPTSEPTTNWRLNAFDDASWLSGMSGFGFGDNDDATIVTVPKSIFIRKKFTIDNAAAIQQMVFHMDYDDGFVAYLNGVEIARALMDAKGTLPRFDVYSSGLHEAQMYQNLPPDKFVISNPSSVLKTGENVLAIQIHNSDAASSDLTAIPFLSVGTIEKPVSSRKVDLLNLASNDFHTNFKISADGESLYLSNPSGVIADSVRLGALSLNTSFGRTLKDPLTWAVYTTSTPDKENTGDALSGESAGIPTFGSPGGVYSAGLKVALTPPDQKDSIYYTLDGSEPTRKSFLYSTGISMNTTKVLKARILKYGFLPGKTVTNSYILYVNRKLPVISLSMNPPDLWDYNTGIYVLGPNAEAANPNFGANFWQDWEKVCHFEMMEPTGDKVIDLDAGVKIFGNYSRANAQKSMTIHARKSFGTNVIKYKFFKERPFDEFKSIVLRNSGNDWNNTMFRDGLLSMLTIGLNFDQMAYRPATIFLNGDYWGILNIREKIDENFIASNDNVNANDVIMLENDGLPLIGSADDWWKMYNFIDLNSMIVQANYDQVTAQMDVNSFIDYFASNIFYANWDWPGNNIRYWKTTGPDSRWRWIMHDVDFGLGIWGSKTPEENSLAFATATDGPFWPNPPWSTLILRKLLENTGFRNQFINRFADLMNSTFLPDRINKAIDQKRDVISEEMIRHLQKWNGGSQSNWLVTVQQMKTFVTARPFNVFTHIRQKFNFQTPQVLNLFTDSLEGFVQVNSLKLTKYPWRGSYFKEVPVTLTAIPKAGFRFLRWDGLTAANTLKTITIAPTSGMQITAVFESDGSHYDDIVINEISFNNDAPTDPGDWAEIYNKGITDIDISGWKMTDSDPSHQFFFPSGTWIKAGEYLVVSNDLVKINAVFGPIKNLVGTFAFGLGNTVDAVKLYARDDQLIDEVNYGNDVPWQTYTFNELWSLELINPTKDNNKGLNWVLSEKNGTPGLRNTPYIPDVIGDLTLDKPTTKLLQNYPNPFSEGTYIEFKLDHPGKYSISVLDMNSRIIRNLSGDDQISSIHTLYWDGKDDSGRQVAKGVYFYRLESDGFSEMKRMVKI